MLAKKDMLSSFPNVKLSYENITHKKVYNSDYIVAIPSGKKCFIWFTIQNNKPVCLLLELSDKKEIQEVKMTNTKFSHDLASGTILYGTKFYYSNMNFFCIEDIFEYKSRAIYRDNWQDKLEQIQELLEHNIYQKNYNSYITFGLPVMCNKMDEFETTVSKIGYRLDSVQFKLYNKINNYLVMDYIKFTRQPINNNVSTPVSFFSQFGLTQAKPTTILTDKVDTYKPIEKYQNMKQNGKREIIFQVCADIQVDIYNLYCLNDAIGETEFCGTAHVPDYNTSVMMNKLFRIIKENDNLDALEESDDEEEFENEKEDRFVHLEKKINMVCEFNYKFKKWTPIRVASEGIKISHKTDISMFNMNKQNDKYKKY